MHDINHPQIVAEVTAAVRRYEQALFANDTATLDTLFWDSPCTLRFGVTENLYGHQEISAFRSARRPNDLLRQERRLVVTTFGLDFGTANVEYSQEGSTRIGRMSHTWVRFPDGWRIVAAHVSFLAAPNSQL
jgi:AtzH-like